MCLKEKCSFVQHVFHYPDITHMPKVPTFVDAVLKYICDIIFLVRINNTKFTMLPSTIVKIFVEGKKNDMNNFYICFNAFKHGEWFMDTYCINIIIKIKYTVNISIVHYFSCQHPLFTANTNRTSMNEILFDRFLSRFLTKFTYISFKASCFIKHCS